MNDKKGIKEVFMSKIFYRSVLFIILHFYSRETIIFVHPSTIFGIASELYFPAIQNIKLPGLHKITKQSLHRDCYEKIFLPFMKNYNIYFGEKEKFFYMFNWSGHIYPLKEKKIASKELFDAILKYKQKNPDDELVLIGCSHGGSVILGTANLLKKHNITIEKIVLLGTPINTDNNIYVSRKLFNGNYVFSKIINIYSESDYIQRIDLIFNNLKFCGRILNERKGIINYKIDNIGHINLWHKILWKDPFIIDVPRIMSLFL